MSAQALPYPDDSFDVVISSLALHHIGGPDRPTALAQMRRVLRPGGRLLIAEFRAPSRAVTGHLTGPLAGRAMQHNPIDEYADLIAEAGFTVTGRGDCRPLLTYLATSRPVAEQGLTSRDCAVTSPGERRHSGRCDAAARQVGCPAPLGHRPDRFRGRARLARLG